MAIGYQAGSGSGWPWPEHGCGIAPLEVLDEIFQGLDVHTASIVQQRIAQWGEKRTIIYITHSLQNLERMDCIYVLEKGKLVEQGTLQTYWNRRRVYFIRCGS